MAPNPTTTTSRWILMIVVLFYSSFNHATSTTQEITTTSSSQTQYPAVFSPPPPPPPVTYSPFKPTMAVTVGIVTMLCAITFLIILYCTRNGTISAVAYYLGGGGTGDAAAAASSTRLPIASSARKNSGVDRTIVESLPVFRFGSLRGRKKDGLECAVCLNRFEPAEMLRLLPKCKHAFHVECVDTWLDAHSTCPLCRYRVDPEDLLLVDPIETVPVRVVDDRSMTTTTARKEGVVVESTRWSFVDSIRRVSGRHSSAGERTGGGGGGSGLVPADTTVLPSSYRRSYEAGYHGRVEREPATTDRRSIRKDGLLLPTTIDSGGIAAGGEQNRVTAAAAGKKLEHQIIISDESAKSLYKRWSDVLPSDLLYLRSEMVMNDSRRSTSRRIDFQWREGGRRGRGSRSVFNNNGRSVSEITGLTRLATTTTTTTTPTPPV